jgi:hypothetical protein
MGYGDGQTPSCRHLLHTSPTLRRPMLTSPRHSSLAMVNNIGVNRTGESTVTAEERVYPWGSMASIHSLPETF